MNLHPYYIEKEKKNEELIECWAYAVVIMLGGGLLVAAWKFAPMLWRLAIEIVR